MREVGRGCDGERGEGQEETEKGNGGEDGEGGRAIVNVYFAQQEEGRMSLGIGVTRVITSKMGILTWAQSIACPKGKCPCPTSTRESCSQMRAE